MIQARRLRPAWFGAITFGLSLVTSAQIASDSDVDTLLTAAGQAESRLESRLALDLYLRVLKADPQNPTLLQKVARQYSDLVVDQQSNGEKRAFAQQALDFSQQALALRPDDAVNALSVAISYGKLAVYSDPGDKVRYSRFVKSYSERALELDPRYAWAHHILGRWHHEVASLNGATRFFVRLIYGGLPPASVASAIEHLNQATKLEPTELNHFLELGFAYAAANQLTAARAAWRHGLAMPSRGKHDAEAKARAQLALKRAG